MEISKDYASKLKGKVSRGYKSKVIIVTAIISTIALGLIVTILIFALNIKFIIGEEDNIGDSHRNIIESEKVLVNEDGTTEKLVPVIRTKQKVYKNAIILKSQFQEEFIPESLVPENAVTSLDELEGKVLSRTYNKGETLVMEGLMKSKLKYQEDEEIFHFSFNEGSIPPCVQEGDLINIYLYKKDEIDPRVVSGKRVITKSDDGNLMLFYLNSTEADYLRDAADNGMLYISEYIDEDQPVREVTYVPEYLSKDGNK